MDPIRRRRRSNLGKRPLSELPCLLPAPSFTVAKDRGLGRTRSDKKEHPVLSRSKCPAANPTSYVKRLFLSSPQDSLGSNTPQSDSSVGKRLFTKVGHPDFNNGNISLNETGVNVIKSPTDISSETSSTNESSKYLSSLYSKYSIYDKFERPVSPGPSRYSQLLLEECAALKPPVDPDYCINSLPLESLNLGKDSHKIKENPQENEKNSEINSSSNENEDLDTTDTFILAEKTIIHENQTLVDTQSEQTFKKPIPLAVNNKRLDPVVEEEDSNSDEELYKILERCNQMSDQINAMSDQINNTKQLVQRVINKQKIKTRNKENAPLPLSVNKKMNKWMNDLKSENPSLLKTPKITKPRLSMMDQSTIWTPHSLSSVLHEQMDELFD